ncbi:hypothetical protein [Streptomyces violens]|uniref:hypothetical protein n=1 Tax=Streptomyces violens TaxID=66377 RepID=UPI0012FE816A|nr:hypothetical protein [Streptomyces violens]
MRMFARCTAALLGMTAGALFLAPSAHGAPTLLSCEGQQTASYSPAMTNEKRTLTAKVEENYDCTLAPKDIRSGSGKASFKEQASCLVTAQPTPPDEIQYTWNSGKTSTVKFTVTDVKRAANGTTTVTSVGKVTGGPGKDSIATRVVVLPALDLAACSGEGVKSQKGPATLKFVGAP